MELKDYTTEELKAELKRRAEEKRKEDAEKPKCKNCKHCMSDPRFHMFFRCSVNTYKQKGHVQGYCIRPSDHCDKFEKGDEKDFIKELFYGL